MQIKYTKFYPLPTCFLIICPLSKSFGLKPDRGTHDNASAIAFGVWWCAIAFGYGSVRSRLGCDGVRSRLGVMVCDRVWGVMVCDRLWG